MDLSRAAARLHAWFASLEAPAGHATCSMPLPKAQADLRGRLMNSVPRVIPRESLDWPFFEPRHRAVGEALDRFVLSGAIAAIDHGDVDGACRKLVRALGDARLLDCAVAAPDGDLTTIDSRSICLSRESLAYADGLADFA